MQIEVANQSILSKVVVQWWEHWRLVLVRLVWLSGFGLTVGVFIPAIVYNYIYRRLDALTLYSRALDDLNLSADFYAAYMTSLESIMALVFLITSALIFWRRQDNGISMVMALGLMTYGTTQGPSVYILAGAFPEWGMPVAVLWMLRSVAALLVFCLFPDGRFIPRWLRWLVLPYTLWEAVHAYVVFVLMEPGDDKLLAHELFLIVPLLCFVIGFIAQVYRYRNVSNAIERQQTKWVVAGLALAVFGNATFLTMEFAFPTLIPSDLQRDQFFRLFYRMGNNLILIYLPVTLLAVSIAIAILRYRLWDIDIVINRALVYSGLTAVIVSIYALVIGLLSVVFQAQTSLLISMVATGVVAVLFNPLRERLQRAVNHLMYGERDDPYAVISHLGQRLQGALDPHSLLPEICQTVAQALRIPYVAVEIRRGESGHHPSYQPAASYGTQSREPLVLPLTHQGEVIGRMLIEPGNRDEAFIRTDWHLLADVARHAGIGVYIVQLTHDLQRSRQNLVTAREEERRRLRRDLHDGLGPTIASMTLKLDAAQNVLTRDPDRATLMLSELRTQSQTVLGEVRRIAYELRPPVLDELGITGALQEHINRLNPVEGDDPTPCRITLDAPPEQLDLPAAVEVAVYRIVTEAVTNVTRHAGACQCQVRLWLEDKAFCVEVADDGSGLPDAMRQGVGLASMRERAAELSGTFQMNSAPNQGTRISVTLPL